jgi:hypothetical protein
LGKISGINWLAMSSKIFPKIPPRRYNITNFFPPNNCSNINPEKNKKSILKKRWFKLKCPKIDKTSVQGAVKNS